MSNEIPLIPTIPQGLRDAAQRGTLVPFVGAGVSMLGGCPSWAKLADDALAACIKADKFNHGQHEQIRALAPRMKLSIARAIEAEHGLHYARLIEPENYSSNAAGRRVYRSLGKLGKTFVTTNYDSWLDTEIVDTKVSVEDTTTKGDSTSATPRTRRRIIDVNDFTPANLSQDNCVFHLHGSMAPMGLAPVAYTFATYCAMTRRSRTGRTATGWCCPTGTPPCSSTPY